MNYLSRARDAMATRMFPIQRDDNGPAGSVPWAVAEEAYRAYVADGHGDQSLERLAQRGGFSWGELVSLIRGPHHYVGHRCSTPDCWTLAAGEGSRHWLPRLNRYLNRAL